MPVNDDVPALCWIVPGLAIPVNGLPVDVRGRDDAVLCAAFIAVAVLNDVPGFGAVARISVSIGSSLNGCKNTIEKLIFAETRCAEPVVILNAKEKHQLMKKNLPNNTRSSIT